jgi:hypothetical protein
VKWWWYSEETGGKCKGVLRKHKLSDCKGSAFLKDKNAKAAKAAATLEAKAATIKANVATITTPADDDESMESYADPREDPLTMYITNVGMYEEGSRSTYN